MGCRRTPTRRLVENDMIDQGAKPSSGNIKVQREICSTSAFRILQNQFGQHKILIVKSGVVLCVPFVGVL